MWTRVLCAAAVLALAGCSSVSDSADQGRQEALSAVSSARLAVTLAQDGTGTWALAETTVGDAAEELRGSEQSLSEVEPGTPDESRTKREALASIRSAVDAVGDVEEALQYGSAVDLKDAVAELERIEDELS